ncbi:uncharacterized protein N7459_003846 [Penicillium hispanicum]|uniref:uncharacterized protein n=1 Tax=Penicillium hispanicum TaxID=1080232 RepID=UPI0025401BE7|nr:uncharacterized protein N7459_003846 [Penicillium hispanicum]KAJ5584046.1 hypothetical protein N7459_003846 [Penicillium hispanicum]
MAASFESEVNSNNAAEPQAWRMRVLRRRESKDQQVCLTLWRCTAGLPNASGCGYVIRAELRGRIER